MELNEETINRITRGSVFSTLQAERKRIDTLKAIKEQRKRDIQKWNSQIEEAKENNKALDQDIRDAQSRADEIEQVYIYIAEQ